MPEILVSVDQSTVKYNNFNIIMNASFNGIVGDINSAQIKTVIPNNVNYTLPPLTPPLESIDENTVTGGTELVFNIGAITNLGQALVLIFGANFKIGTPSGASYTGEYNLYINNGTTPVATTTSPTVTLLLEPNWILEKTLVIPTNLQPSPGGTAIYLIKLSNIGDAGAPISNVFITDTLPLGMSFDVNFDPIGYDNSNTDPSADAPGIVSGNTVSFTIPNYFGTSYYMVYQVVVSASSGSQLTNTVNWAIDGDYQTPVSYTTTISDLQPYAGIGKFAPTYASPGDKISYDLYFSNTGNGDLTNVEIIDTIPNDVIINQIFPGSYYIPIVNIFPPYSYEVSYEINGTGGFINPQTFPYNNPNTWSYITAPPLPNKITKIRWKFPNVPQGLSTYDPPRLNGEIVANPTGPTVVNSFNILYNGTDTTITATTTLNGMARIDGVKYNTPSTNVFPNQTIKYEAALTAYYSKINEPVIMDLLPAEVQYDNNLTVGLTDYYNQYAFYDLNTPGTPLPTPIVEQLPNYNGTGRTLIRITLPDFALEQRNALYVAFNVKVKVGAVGTIINTFILGNKGVSDIPDWYPDSNKVPDTGDMDHDNITNEVLFQTDPVTNIINFSTSLASNKKVKGALDTEYTEEPAIGKTIPGGSVDYKIIASNIGNVNLESFEIVDILPYIGDTGVISDTPRLSQFEVYFNGIGTVEIVPSIPGDPLPQIEVQYSLSTDPVRFNSTGTGTIGTVNDWTTTPPANLSLVKSIKIKSINTILKPGQDLIINMNCLAPDVVGVGLIAWNSFALQGTYKDNFGNTQNYLPIEPEKVGVMVEQQQEVITIGDLVWNDLNRDGIHQTGEPGVKDVLVTLYKCDGGTTGITATTDVNGNYTMTIPTAGSYYVVFSNIPSGFEFITLGGYVDSTGRRPGCFTVALGDNLDYIDAPIALKLPVINASNKCIHVGDTFNPLVGVTAYDAYGVDITDNIIVTSNTVNVNTPGIYEVTYSVTDAYNQTVTKTIQVKVCQGHPCYQAITDIIESVALEQTALSHILNAEGEKIQMALAMNLTPLQLLTVNRSVKGLVDEISMLESVLQMKLSIITNNEIKDCCDETNN